MQPRTMPRTDIKPGWPYMEADGRVFLFRGGPIQRSDLASWVRESRRRPLVEVVEVSERAGVLAAREGTDAAEPGDRDEATALMQAAKDARIRAARATEGTAGFLILWAWHDPAADLRARLDYDACVFANTADPRLLAGLACVDELYADGWTWEQIDDLSTGILDRLSHGSVDRAITMELRPFGQATGPTT